MEKAIKKEIIWRYIQPTLDSKLKIISALATYFKIEDYLEESSRFSIKLVCNIIFL
jgi:hypothetical protein